MRSSRAIAVIALSLTIPNLARADWPSGAEISGGALVDLTADGLDAIAQNILPAVVPAEIDVGGFDSSDSGFCYSYSAGVENIFVGAQIENAAIVPGNGVLHFDATATISINDIADQMNLYANADTCVGIDANIDCPMYVEPVDVSLSADIALAVDANGNLQATVLDVGNDGSPIDWDFTSELNLRGDCFLGDVIDVIDTVFGWLGLDLETEILNLARPAINDQLQALIPELEAALEDAFSAANIEQDVALGEATMHISLHPDGVTIVPEGIRVSAAAAFSSDQADCIAEYGHDESLETNGGDPVIGEAPVGIPSPFHVGVALDDDVVNQGLFAAYNGGLLCYELSDAGGISINTSLLKTALSEEVFGPTLFPVAQPVLIKTRPKEVPTAKPVGPHDLNIAVNDLGLEFYAELDYRRALMLGADLDVDAGIDLTLDPVTGSLGIAVPLSGDDISASIVHNEFAPGNDDVIAGRFGNLFDSLVAPLLGDLLGNLAFAMPTLSAGTANIGLSSLDMAPTGPEVDHFGVYANVGTVAYANGSGCSGEDGGCGGGCGTQGQVPTRLALLFVPLTLGILRRRRN